VLEAATDPADGGRHANHRLANQAIRVSSDAVLLVEVADTTRRDDTTTKLSLYAKHAVQEVWVADVDRRQLVMFRDPVHDQYASQPFRTESQSAAPLLSPDVTVKWSVCLDFAVQER
jgi:Uma2 family endonuclease